VTERGAFDPTDPTDRPGGPDIDPYFYKKS